MVVVTTERAPRLRACFSVASRYVLSKRWPAVAVLSALAIPLGIQALIKHPSEWQDVFVLAARQLLAGEDIYFFGTDYRYPPFMAVATIPFALLPPLVSRGLWYLLNVACIAAMVRIAWQLAGGRGLDELRKRPSREWIALLVGLLCCTTYILNALAHQQVDIIIGLLLLCGCGYLLAKRDIAVGVCFGLAAACKATPLLWIPYLAWRRRWIAALLVGGVALAGNLVPELISSPPDGGVWLGHWLAQFVLPTQNLEVALGHWARGDVIYNQSFGGMVQRLVNTTLEFGSTGFEVVQRGLVQPLPLKVAVYSALLALLATSAIVAARAQRRGEPGYSEPSPIALECSIVLLLMLLMSPMSSQAHFVTLILPGFCLARLMLGTRDRMIGSLVIAAAVLATLTNKDPIGAKTYTVLLWSGSVTFSALLLWCGCVIALVRSPWPALRPGSSWATSRTSQTVA